MASRSTPSLPPSLPIPPARSRAPSRIGLLTYRHEMRDDVHWVATDPQDRRLGDWAVDVYSFAWSCQAGHPPEAISEEGGQAMEKYLAELENVDSPMSCWQFNSRWSSA